MSFGGSPDPHAAYRQQAAQHFDGDPAREHPTHDGGSTSLPGGRLIIDISGTGGGGPEHRQIALLPGEDTLFAGDFTQFPTLRHITSGLVVTQRRLVVRHPQYFLWFIKTGYSESACALDKLNLVRTGRTLSRNRLITAMMFGGPGVFLLLTGLTGVAIQPVIGLLILLLSMPLVAVGAVYLWLARHLALTVFNDSGTAMHIDVDKREYHQMVTAAQLIQRLILGTESSAGGEAPVASAIGTPPATPASWPSASPTAAEQPTTAFTQPAPARVAPDRASAPPSIFRG